jgi:hypothetical protein
MHRQNAERAAIATSLRCLGKDDQGNFLGASAMTCPGVSNLVVLETLACRDDLASTSDLSCPKIIVASDCNVVADDIVNRRGDRHGSSIKEVEATVAEKTDCYFIQQGRMSNKEAPCLPKHALALDEGHHLWLLYTPYDVTTPVNILNQ